MNQPGDYRNPALISFQELSGTFAKEFSKFCVLLHHRSYAQVLPALENTCCDGTGFTEARVFTNKMLISVGQTTFLGKRCPEQFAQTTGRLEAEVRRSGQS